MNLRGMLGLKSAEQIAEEAKIAAAAKAKQDEENLAKIHEAQFEVKVVNTANKAKLTERRRKYHEETLPAKKAARDAQIAEQGNSKTEFPFSTSFTKNDVKPSLRDREAAKNRFTAEQRKAYSYKPKAHDEIPVGGTTFQNHSRNRDLKNQLLANKKEKHPMVTPSAVYKGEGKVIRENNESLRKALLADKKNPNVMQPSHAKRMAELAEEGIKRRNDKRDLFNVRNSKWDIKEYGKEAKQKLFAAKKAAHDAAMRVKAAKAKEAQAQSSSSSSISAVKPK